MNENCEHTQVELREAWPEIEVHCVACGKWAVLGAAGQHRLEELPGRWAVRGLFEYGRSLLRWTYGDPTPTPKDVVNDFIASVPDRQRAWDVAQGFVRHD